MKILLVQSYTILQQPPIFPIGLSYIATSLLNTGKNYDIQIFDMNIYDDPFKPLQEKIKTFQPDVVGVSIRNMKVAVRGKHESCLGPHTKTIKKIREWAPNAKIIAGGTAFSLYSETVMKRIPEIDIGFFGEGEQRFPILLENLNEPYKVKGIYYRTPDSKVIFTGFPSLIDFSEIPPPRKDLVNMRDYMSDTYCIGVQSKRGCLLNCQHCCDKYLLGSNVRIRNPKDIVDEIEELNKKYTIKFFFFSDQIFNIPKKHAEDICHELINRKLDIKWSAWFNEKHIDEEFLRLVKKAGCHLVDFSPDAADDRVLEGYGKNFSSKDLENVVDLAKKVDIPVTFSFMINGPHDTLGSILGLIKFFIKAKLKLGKNLRLHSNIMVPLRIYPHSELQKLAIEKGVISADDDLIEARFYNQPPLRYVAQGILFSITSLWYVKQAVKKIIPKK